jgi:hypothetical protein
VDRTTDTNGGEYFKMISREWHNLEPIFRFCVIGSIEVAGRYIRILSGMSMVRMLIASGGVPQQYAEKMIRHSFLDTDCLDLNKADFLVINDIDQLQPEPNAAN